MADRIGSQHGLEARRKKENELHPGGNVAWERSATTFKTLVAGHNETQDRLVELEAWAEATRSRPF